MSDDHEDYRLKNARQGKAAYLPGKSEEEIKVIAAKEEAQRSARLPRTLLLTNQQWSDLDTAIPDLIELLNDVGNMCFDLSYEQDLDQPWVNSVLRLAARAIRGMEEKEIDVLEKLDNAIRTAPDKVR
ncbi:MAG: hypothetical protein NTX73_05975 [Rhodobacterales bacterium]|nr:hypothetical protein [Rhodobacterales bacterium]